MDRHTFWGSSYRKSPRPYINDEKALKFSLLIGGKCEHKLSFFQKGTEIYYLEPDKDWFWGGPAEVEVDLLIVDIIWPGRGNPKHKVYSINF